MRARGLRGAVGLAAVAFVWAAASPAQESGQGADPLPPALSIGEPVLPGVVRSPVLTIDADQLFSESRFGQRLTDDIQARSEALAAENRAIARDLEAEEQVLTRRRAEMSPEEFRAEAEAFDTRVQGIRQEQDAKERALGAQVQAAEEAFLTAVRPVLGQLMAERGAAVVLDRRSVVLSVGAVDITEVAVARIDAEMGEGMSLPELEAPQD
jgi:Skp family chaperone for outer membrane proteins